MSERIAEQDTGNMRQIPYQAGSRQNVFREGGFTLVELMVAIAVLAIGMLGGMAMIVMGMQTNYRGKTDTAATMLDQEIIEKFATLKNYPKPTTINITDCAVAGASTHLADIGQAASPGNGAVLYTAGTAPTTSQIGDVDWTQATPTLATTTTAGYGMRYQICSGDIYEVRWNITNLTPAVPPAGSSGRLSLLTVSARPVSAVVATAAGAANQAVLYARPVTLRSLIED